MADDIFNSLNLGGLTISNQVRKRSGTAWRCAPPPVAQKMDVCMPDADENGKMQHAMIKTDSLPRKRRDPIEFQSRSEPPRQRDLARKLYVLPYFLSGYLQLLINLVVAGFCIYFMWCFYSTIRDDIDTKVQLFSEEVEQTMAKCSKDFRENKCGTELRVPAMEEVCRTWQLCMQQDPMTVATRSKFSAETMGEGLNAFFEKITWKTLACMCFLFFGFLISYNAAFYFAARQNPERMHPNAHWDAAAMGYYRPMPLPPAIVNAHWDAPLADNYPHSRFWRENRLEMRRRRHRRLLRLRTSSTE